MREPRGISAQIRHMMREALGHVELRPGQEAAIRALLAGHDTLAVLPTGSGKSAIYQIAGMHIPGPTLVVSPLIALQQDQLEAIQDQAVGEAAVVNSTVRAAERRETFADLATAALEFLFITPEQLGNAEVLEHLRTVQPTLFVVDEAHCISEWGHDFRPAYLRLGAAIEQLGHPTVLALTATAAPPVREEIVERLGMRNAQVVVQGFDRPNIWFGVEKFQDEATRQRALVERVVNAPKPGIIYAATRKRTEEICATLADHGVRADFYHAGMAARERERIQTAFMTDEIEVIVATIAFGMGIDKPNVQFVFHYNMSDALDAYYQEVGRAGRDGTMAQAILFYAPSDLRIRRFLAGGGQFDEDQVTRVFHAVQHHPEPVAPSELRAETGLSRSRLTTLLGQLEAVNAVTILPTGAVAAGEVQDADAVATAVLRAQERYRKFDQSRIEMIRSYAEVRDCRRKYILNYFGEDFAGPCGLCDNCDAGITVQRDKQNEPFPLNSRVAHREWGEGLVMRYEGDKMVVLFDTVGYKTLAIDIVTGQGLVAALD